MWRAIAVIFFIFLNLELLGKNVVSLATESTFALDQRDSTLCTYGNGALAI